MAALFVSDLHLDAIRPRVDEQFLKFLAGEARDADALYVLGDLFESWVGDDCPAGSQDAIVAGLAALTAAGVPCFVMHGNRDFLLGDDFCARTGARLLPDPTLLTLYGERVLVMHGDALCSDDAAYQRLRATVRDREWQRRFLALPRAARETLAGAARHGSRAHTATLGEVISDVSPASVALALRGAGCSVLLHGHTHRPAIHTFEVDGRPCTRIVLGDWFTQGSVLRWDASGPELKFLPR